MTRSVFLLVVWSAGAAAPGLARPQAAQKPSPQDAPQAGAKDPAARQAETRAGGAPTSDDLQRQIDELKARLDALSAEAKPKDKSKGHVTFYGHLDLSFDVANKGIQGHQTTAQGPFIANQAGPDPGFTPLTPLPPPFTTSVGTLGWQAAIASNSSYLGVRGGRELGASWSVVFQVETQIDVAATPGVASTNFHDDLVVRGALAFRTSYLGFAGPYGALKLGKSDTPYYLSTSRLNPFLGTVGTNTSIMGNTGGDNRVEFAYRMPHAIWYESPSVMGLNFAALFSPGQNRNTDNLIAAQGDPGCTGAYAPTPLQALLCNDGSFSNAFSAALAYDVKPVYVSGAYELHQHVNRTTDEFSYGGASPDGSIGIADEHAWKLAAQVLFPTGTSVGFAYEQMKRHNPYQNQNFNERDRDGLWAVVAQQLPGQNEVDVGWGHAGKTPGDVGTRRADGTVDAGPVANEGNLYTALVRHRFLDGQPTVYLSYARVVNQNGAHYDLGAGNHGIQYDCHDGNPIGVVPPPGGGSPGPAPTSYGAGGRCWTGATLQAVSAGITYNF